QHDSGGAKRAALPVLRRQLAPLRIVRAENTRRFLRARGSRDHQQERQNGGPSHADILSTCAPWRCGGSHCALARPLHILAPTMRTLLLSLGLLLSACGDNGGGTGGSTGNCGTATAVMPTAADVQTRIFQCSCTFSGCHDSSSNRMLNMKLDT